MFEAEDCPCCGDSDRALVPLRAQGSDFSRLVCEDCREDALDGDQDVWSFYWHSTEPEHDDPTWVNDNLELDEERPSPRIPRQTPTDPQVRPKPPEGNPASLAELIKRREQLEHGGALRAKAKLPPAKPPPVTHKQMSEEPDPPGPSIPERTLADKVLRRIPFDPNGIRARLERATRRRRMP